jgi:hypothetical protein
VIATPDEAGVIRYRKSESFPTWPENGPGTAAFDQQNKEMAEEEERQRDRADAEVLRNSPQNRQREELVALIRQVADERIDARIDDLRRTFENSAVTRARLLLRREQTTEGAA